MAKVTMTIEDVPAVGGKAIEVTIQSDPPLPIATVTDPQWIAALGGGTQDLDMKRATSAQVAARLAAQEIMDGGEAAALFCKAEQ